MRNLIYGLLSVGALICSEAHTQAQNMNLAGVYEANEKANGGVRQLYAYLISIRVRRRILPNFLPERQRNSSCCRKTL